MLSHPGRHRNSLGFGQSILFNFQARPRHPPSTLIQAGTSMTTPALIARQPLPASLILLRALATAGDRRSPATCNVQLALFVAPPPVSAGYLFGHHHALHLHGP